MLVSGPFLAACALLAWSGAAKLARPRATSTAARAIGLPSSTAVVRAFGALELGAAVLGTVIGHVGALIVAFMYAGLAVLALRLLRHAPATPCGCLGSSSAPASWAHVAVNGAAALVAVAAAFAGAPLSRITELPLTGVPFVVLVVCAARLAALTIDALPALIRAVARGRPLMSVLIAIETVVIVLLTVLVAGLLKSHAEILRRLHAIDQGGELDDASAVPATIALGATHTGSAGRRAHDIVGETLVDDAVHVAITGTRHRTLLAFLSSSCLTCREFWDEFARADELGLPADMRLVVVAKDAREESVTALREVAPAGLTVVMSSDAWAAYDVPGSPYFVLVDGAAGRVEGEGTGATWPQVRNLIVQANGDGAFGSSGAAREARIDRELLAHGIGPGDPLLYHEETRS